MILSRAHRLLAISVLCALHVAARPSRRTYDTHNYYALEHIPGGATLAQVATALGVEVVEQAGQLEDVWLVRAPKPMTEITARKDSLDPVVSTFKDLQARVNIPLVSRSEEALHARKVVSSVKLLEPQIPEELVKRAPLPLPVVPSWSKAVATRMGFKDPLFTEQWHLVNDEHHEHSMNVSPVWDMGYTGKGVLTSFLDDGLDLDSDDLKDAFVAEYSHDFVDHLALPRPKGERSHHGTRCAGQVAARRNGVCGVGIAYDSNVAGVRILGGRLTTVDQAIAINYGYKNVTVYNCSWGPRDDGMTLQAPKYIVRKAVVNGINNGRDGKGSIFVFASGNGADEEDQCNYDGYTNSIYSVTVSALDWTGQRPSYSEPCAANMIGAYTSGGGKFIVTTDTGKDECSRYHGGTSAAAPNVVGVFALALQARPDLTWRDIQYLCVETARKVNPDDPDWERTATGRLYSYTYGYGALDAYAYVKAAESWKLVKPQAWFHTETVVINNGRFHDFGDHDYEYEGGNPIGPNGIEDKMTITTQMLTENNLESLEHIDVRVWIRHTKRGDVKVDIISPNGIRSVLAAGRINDESTTGFPGWRFMTIKHWGENPVGQWTLKITDNNDPEHNGALLGWNMAFWGSTIDPAKAKKFVEPVVDNALPPIDDPDRPILNEPVSTPTTQHAKPTDHLPPSTEKASAATSTTQKVAPTATPQEDEAAPGGSWYPKFPNLDAKQKWFYGGLGAILMCLISGTVYFWRRRVAQRKLAEYTSLAADDIQMGLVRQEDSVPPGIGGGLASTRTAVFESRAEREPTQSSGDQGQYAVDPPAVKGLGFHTGFLDDDELSPALSPTGRYRDRPESPSHEPLRRPEDMNRECLT